ncbi:hypothetical protein GOODEAATRI_017863, partial [Goodea atripinnis]
ICSDALNLDDIYLQAFSEPFPQCRCWPTLPCQLPCCSCSFRTRLRPSRTGSAVRCCALDEASATWQRPDEGAGFPHIRVQLPSDSVRCHIFFPLHSTVQLKVCSYVMLKPKQSANGIQIMSPSAAAASSRPHPYRKRPTLSNVSNQHTHHNMQPNYNLRYQDSYSPEYPPPVQQVITFYCFTG